ncbi:MAG TPA: flavin reductase family protein [Solirubrobacteraceae bacterium]|nr:flavin reductase family protein [Solirubrobacteraceae bacterium]
MSSTVHSISAQDFRTALGAFATGVTVVTTSGEEHSYGMTANAFSSVSLDPPLILVCVKWPSEGAEHIERNGVFAVNILAAHQEPLSRYFSSRDRPRGRDAFRDVPSQVVASGSPIIDDVLAYMDCALHATHEAGDHRIYIGQVLALECAVEKPPLLFHGGGYRLLADG